MHSAGRAGAELTAHGLCATTLRCNRSQPHELQYVGSVARVHADPAADVVVLEAHAGLLDLHPQLVHAPLLARLLAHDHHPFLDLAHFARLPILALAHNSALQHAVFGPRVGRLCADVADGAVARLDLQPLGALLVLHVLCRGLGVIGCC